MEFLIHFVPSAHSEQGATAFIDFISFIGVFQALGTQQCQAVSLVYFTVVASALFAKLLVVITLHFLAFYTPDLSHEEKFI